MKRRIFYVASALWSAGLSARDIAVYAYLCFCADREGRAYPALSVIAEKCGISKHTAQSAVRKLEECGLIQIEARFRTGVSGGQYPISNLYHLPTREKKQKQRPCRAEPAGKARAREQRETQELSEILEGCGIDLYEDAAFVSSVRLAMGEMFFAESLRVGGAVMGQSAVRERLHRLNANALDHVYRSLTSLSEPPKHAGYLKSCLFNAPGDLAACAASRKC